MRILMVGPGIMPIPSDGWGAVETVIWQQKVHLEELGHTVDILNERGTRNALDAAPRDYDLVHLHYDEFARLWTVLARWQKFPLLITTHYGYAADPARWDRYYKRVWRWLKRSPGLLVLTDEIAEAFRGQGYGGWLGVLPNGTEVAQIAFEEGPGNGRAICLGKIEPRKRQAPLARMLAAAGTPGCDFVGPIVDPAFEEAEEGPARYLGTWTREEVHQRLTGYSALVLASDGEAHPLVVLEAMAAGLSLVVTPEAAAHLDRSLPWVFVCDRIEDVPAAVERAVEENPAHRAAIHAHAADRFDWRAVAERYGSVTEGALRAMR